MGAFYANITIVCDQPAAIMEEFKASRTGGYVAAHPGRYTFVALNDEQTGAPELLEMFSTWFSGRTGCTVLGVIVHDDDIMNYVLARDGKVVDEYNSSPDYFTDGEAPPNGGNAGKLATVFGEADRAAAVERILRAREDPAKPDQDYPYVLETDRHRALAMELGLPEWIAGFGFTYALQGELPKGLDPTIVVRVN